MASSNHDWLLSQLPGWEGEGLITADAAAILRARADKEKAHRGQLGLVIFGGLGAALVAGGLIALLAHNWDEFPRWLRVILGFAPMVAGQALVAWVLRGGDSVATWIRETVAVFAAISVGACLGIVSQIYHMGGQWETFLLAWCLLALPVAWLLRSSSVATLYLIGITHWATFSWGWWHRETSNVAWYPVLVLLLAGWWPGTQWRSATAPPLGFRWVAAVCFMFAAFMGADKSSVEWPLPLATLFILLPVSGSGISRRPFQFIGFVVLVCWTLIKAVEATNPHYHHQPPALPALWWLFALVVLAMAIPAALARRWAVLALASTLLLPVLERVLSGGWLAAVATAQLVATGIFMVMPAFRGEEGAPRLGALLISLVILTHFGNSELSLTGKGLGFIIVGAGFILFNITLARRSRQTQPS